MIDKSKERRDEHNKQILERYKAGETLSQFSSTLSFFPPRPVIKKDEDLVKKVFNIVDTSKEIKSDE